MANFVTRAFTIKAYFQILRPINLILIALAQFLLYICYLEPLFIIYSQPIVLRGGLLYLFIIDTLLLAGGSYIINDILDIKADLVNKKNKVYVGKKITLTSATYYYITVLLFGFIIAIYIGFRISKPQLIIIYPITSILLYCYSKYFKGTVWIGNFVVAAFCAFVPGILWFSESEGINNIAHINSNIILLFTSYVLFGFFSTLTREVVKDLEDIEGDESMNYTTIPIIYGVNFAKKVTLIYGICTFLTSCIWLYTSMTERCWMAFSSAILLILFPIIYILSTIIKAHKKADFAKISLSLKILIASSLIVFLTIRFCL